MKIIAGNVYKVEKFFADARKDSQNYGQLSGEDVTRLLHGYEYDETFEMWFSPKGTIGYSITEA